MARTGVSYESVAVAADALVAEGQKPTLSAVRERLGNTGSMNTIHRHWTLWSGQHKPAPRKINEPNTRLLQALGTELSKAAEEAASEAEANLAQAMKELAVFSANGEALEAERDALAEQLLQVAKERDVLAGKGEEQLAEMARLNQELERERNELASVRRHLVQAELRVEAVPRLEAEILEVRALLAAEQTARVEADKTAATAVADALQAAAVAEAQRAAAVAAQTQAEARLATVEKREEQAHSDLVAAHTAHQATREQLTSAVGSAAAAQAELKALREAVKPRKDPAVGESGRSEETADATAPTRARGKK
ncbi:DNA-binding protein [Cupriavidus basilensis]|uniref:DNA-binding protein n=1 Tax=Cupriavidus basilensis TaxID=68895 RepID=UPI0007510467|nr:DNA-binding protein [Cupriavidus basilensis]